MHRALFALLAIIVAAAVAIPAVAGDNPPVTLSGDIVCAKCTLKEEGRDKCQNVLAVEVDGKTTHFYIDASEAGKEIADVCMAAKPAKVTGTVSQKDGKVWIAATKIEIVEKQKS